MNTQIQTTGKTLNVNFKNGLRLAVQVRDGKFITHTNAEGRDLKFLNKVTVRLKEIIVATNNGKDSYNRRMERIQKKLTQLDAFGEVSTLRVFANRLEEAYAELPATETEAVEA